MGLWGHPAGAEQAGFVGAWRMGVPAGEETRLTQGVGQGSGGTLYQRLHSSEPGGQSASCPIRLGGGAHQDVQGALRALLVLFDGGEHGQHEAGEDQQEPEDRGRLGQPVGSRTRPRCGAQDTPTATPRTPHSLAHTPCLSAQPGQHHALGKAPKLSMTGHKLCLLHGWESEAQERAPTRPSEAKVAGTPYVPHVSSFAAVLSGSEADTFLSCY